MTTVNWAPLGGPTAIASFALSSLNGRVAIPGDTFTDGLIDTLVRAEVALNPLAAIPKEGFPVPVPATPIGGARANMLKSYRQDADKSHAIVYLGCLGAVRIAHGQATEAHGQMGVIQTGVLVALTAVGIAATVAAAWYAKERHAATVHVEGQTARAVAVVNGAATIASAAVAAGQPIPPEVVQMMSGLAKYEAQEGGILWPMVAAVGLTVGVGGAAYGYMQSRKGKRGS